MGNFGFLKPIMFFFNGIIFLAGIGNFAVGIWAVLIKQKSIMTILQDLGAVPPEMKQGLNVGCLLIVVGSVLLLLGFLGCYGTFRESSYMLLMFFVFILIVFIAEVTGAIVIAVFKGKIPTVTNKVGATVAANIKTYYGKEDKKTFTQHWDTTMDLLKCCGFNNVDDFTGSPFNKDSLYPIQCCTGIFCDKTNADNAKISGCQPAITKLFESNSVPIIAVAFSIAVLELLAMIVSMTLYCQIKSTAA